MTRRSMYDAHNTAQLYNGLSIPQEGEIFELGPARLLRTNGRSPHLLRPWHRLWRRGGNTARPLQVTLRPPL